ncbi:hypothetical protein [Mycoavidus sp. B2-EB]|uniref:hypothetical protein n=1 Tax=Mycoavidus sp. B2-EB TaxID=2651972 RepID=UPI001627EA8B|nr:hypothetical protein [Mycoavidus sp. B2-EB]BBO59404.1 hypothetical protein MPB2EB_0520 [Mycoavidus sp. B2-EB]
MKLFKLASIIAFQTLTACSGGDENNTESLGMPASQVSTPNSVSRMESASITDPLSTISAIPDLTPENTPSNPIVEPIDAPTSSASSTNSATPMPTIQSPSSNGTDWAVIAGNTNSSERDRNGSNIVEPDEWQRILENQFLARFELSMSQSEAEEEKEEEEPIESDPESEWLRKQIFNINGNKFKLSDLFKLENENNIHIFEDKVIGKLVSALKTCAYYTDNPNLSPIIQKHAQKQAPIFGEKIINRKEINRNTYVVLSSVLYTIRTRHASPKTIGENDNAYLKLRAESARNAFKQNPLNLSEQAYKALRQSPQCG